MMQPFLSNTAPLMRSYAKLAARRLPEAVLICGKNGSGKSTITSALSSDFIRHGIKFYYNADDLSKVSFINVTEELILDDRIPREKLEDLDIEQAAASLRRTGKFSQDFLKSFVSLKRTHERYEIAEEKIEKIKLMKEMYHLEEEVSNYLVDFNGSFINEMTLMSTLYKKYIINKEEQKPEEQRNFELIERNKPSFERSPYWRDTVNLIHRNKSIGTVANLCSAYLAQQKCFESIKHGESFARETVLSTTTALEPIIKPSRVKYFKRAIFVTTGNLLANIGRTIAREQTGGHSVPPKSIIKRGNLPNLNFLNALKKRVFNHVTLFDNSSEDIEANMKAIIQLRLNEVTHSYEPIKSYQLLEKKLLEEEQ